MSNEDKWCLWGDEFNKRKRLFAGTVPANKNLFAGTSSGKLELICRNLFRQIRAYLPEPLR